jgi:hypothetical protein
MRYFGNRQIPQAPAIPDTTLNLLLTAATGQAFDYPTGTDLFRVSAGSTISGAASLTFNPSSTAAALPTTGGAVSSTVGGQNIQVAVGDSRPYQRPRGTTGFSVIAGSSMSVTVEFWSRAGTTG